MPKKTAQTSEQLLAENEELRARLEEAEETLRAIRTGEVDALIVSGAAGDQIFTLTGADYPYRVLIEDMSEGALTLTVDGVILYANRRFAEMIKTPLEQVIGSNIQTWIMPGNLAILQALMQPNESPSRQGKQIALLASNGTSVPGYFSVRALQGKDLLGNFVMVVTDLTEQKRNEAIVNSEKLTKELLADSKLASLALLSVIEDQKLAEQALRESEEKYRLLTESMKDVVWTMDAETMRFLYVSPSVQKLRGYTPEEILAEPMDAALTPEAAEFVRNNLNQQIAKFHAGTASQDRFYTSEVEQPCKDGTTVWTEVISNYYLNEKTGHVEVRAVTRDISERKQAEQARQTTFRRFQAILSNLYGGILVVGNDERVEFANQAFCELFDLDFTAEDLFGLEASEIIRRIENVYADPSQALARIREIVTNGQPVRDEEIAIAGGRAYIRDFIPITIDGKQYGRLWNHIDITERKLTEVALLRSELDLNEAQAIAHIGNWKWDVSKGEITWSEEMYRIFGIDKSSFTGRLGGVISKVVHPDDLHIVLPSNAANIANEPIEYRIILPDASIHHIWAKSGETIFGNDGKPAFMTGVAQDITERKQAEEALRASETFVKTVLDNLPIGIAVNSVNPAVTFDYINDNFLKFYRTTREKLAVPDAFWNAVYEDADFREEIRNKVLADSATGNPEDMIWVDVPITRKGEETTYITARNIPILNNPLMISAVWDVTDRKRAEQILRESEARFRSLFENMLNGFAYCKMIFEDGRPQDFIYLDVNQAFETLTGLKGAVGKTVSELIPGIRETDPDLLEMYGNVALTGTPVAFENYVKALEMWFSISVYSPQKEYFVAVFDVITKRKQAEQQLTKYTERLEEMVDERTHALKNAQEQLVRQERLATLGQLAGSIGHELRNPLGVISNAVYFLKMALPEANTVTREYLDIIENETRTSDKIITDLLDFTRIKSMDRKAVPVSDLIQQTLERYPAPPAVELTLVLPPDLPPVYADPRHIVQILGNLVTNACQAMPEGGKLSLYARRQDDMMTITVQDSGVGITTENMKKLFEPLFTTKTKGIGLGLAVSRKLAEANGGRIEVQSEPEKGSTFTLFLPIHGAVPPVPPKDKPE
jgi:PAS domain S-box-containing protein